MINKERLWDHITELGKIGYTEGKGITRTSYTPEDRAAYALVNRWMEEAGLVVRRDAVGNMYGRMEGKNPNAPVVLTGSHIDTVVCGGRFDGHLGILSAIEAVQSMKESGIVPDSPIDVIAIRDEEGVRFDIDLFGSRALAGQLTEEDLAYKDADGISIAEAMRAEGYDPAKYMEAQLNPEEVKAFIELHIEQGKVLEDKNLSVGIPTVISSSSWMIIRFHGEADHAGGTPMRLRHDALVAAAKVIQYVDERARQNGVSVGTVGRIKVEPGAINVIPGYCEFTLDLRDIDCEAADSLRDDVLAYIDQVCKETGITMEPVENLNKLDPCPCNPKIMKVIEGAFHATGHEAFYLPSGAQHDAMRIAEKAPIGMIFVRCEGGISHSPYEMVSIDDCADGADVLRETLLALAKDDCKL